MWTVHDERDARLPQDVGARRSKGSPFAASDTCGTTALIREGLRSQGSLRPLETGVGVVRGRR